MWRNNLVLITTKLSNHKTLFQKCISIKNEKTEVEMKKPVYLALPISDINKIAMYDICYNYINPKHKNNTVLYYMDIDTFLAHIKTEDVNKNIA